MYHVAESADLNKVRANISSIQELVVTRFDTIVVKSNYSVISLLLARETENALEVSLTSPQDGP
jgi:hypothetical protein